jgi:general secretion pathway protein G
VARALARGVTLVEVLIVVAIIAMVAGGVAVFALPKYKEAQVTTAKTGARVIRNAVQQWQLANNEYGTCPTVSQLVSDRQLDAGQNTDDPWGMAFIIACSDDNVSVASYGPDKKQGTKDDIMVPEGAAAGGEP